MEGGGDVEISEFRTHSLCFPALQGVFCPKPPPAAFRGSMDILCAVTLGNPLWGFLSKAIQERLVLVP